MKNYTNFMNKHLDSKLVLLELEDKSILIKADIDEFLTKAIEI